MSELSVLSKALVGDNTDEDTANADGSHSPNLKDLNVEPTGVKGKVAQASEESGSNFPETAVSSKDLKERVEGLKSQISSLTTTVRDGFSRVFRLKTLKRSSGRAPTKPHILKRNHNAKVEKTVSIESVPKGPLDCWEEAYKVANLAIAREILCVSESGGGMKESTRLLAWQLFLTTSMKLIRNNYS